MSDVRDIRTERDTWGERFGTSVGSRVSWGAILAGVVVAFAVYFLLSLLGIAVGLTAADAGDRGWGWAAGIWAIIVVVFSLFIGGWTAARFTVGEDRLEAVLNGAIVWGVSFLLLLWITSVGLNMGYGAMVTAASADRMAADRGVAVAPADPAMAVDRPAAVRREDAAEAAWWAFAGTLLSMAGAIGGAVVGSPTVRSTATRYREEPSRVEKRGPAAS